jgi:uncharacterized Zn-finger protein
MAQHSVPSFANDKGAKDIRIGVKEFKCIGASAPFDHPHIYIDMGKENDTVCPYCSTHYIYDSNVH